MITNERQYLITKAEAERFELALSQADEQNKKLHPKLRKAAVKPRKQHHSLIRSRRENGL